MPEDLAAALDAEPALLACFEGLSNSLQRCHVDSIASAKTEETCKRRIEKTLQLFRDGKKR
ncbi:MAG TPA: YdeI/OmpD-associated family protein [Mycobacteriales bacterium]|nr:YdeI/OmpD-associated family protein [Mycobacteriales bacterium]